MKKTTIILTALIFLFVLNTRGVNAQDDLRDRLENIERMIHVIAERMGVSLTQNFSRIPANFRFKDNLGQGAKSADVKYLQIILNSNIETRIAQSGSGSPGNETDYFGPSTYNAVIRFQNKYREAILQPAGLTAGTGFVGPSTITKLNEILGSGDDTKQEYDKPEEKRLNDIKKIIDLLRERLESLGEEREEEEEDDGISFGELKCVDATKNSITISYKTENAVNASLFRGSLGVKTIGSRNKSGTYVDTNLSPNKSYTFYLRNNITSNSQELARITCSTEGDIDVINKNNLDDLAPKNNISSSERINNERKLIEMMPEVSITLQQLRQIEDLLKKIAPK